MADDKKNKIEDNDIDFNFGDFGNFDIPDLDIDAFDFVPDEISELESRYIKPKLKPMKKDYVLYDNALKFAKETKIDFSLHVCNVGYKRFISTCSGFRSYEDYSIQNCRGKKYRNSWFCESSFFR